MLQRQDLLWVKITVIIVALLANMGFIMMAVVLFRVLSEGMAGARREKWGRRPIRFT